LSIEFKRTPKTVFLMNILQFINSLNQTDLKSEAELPFKIIKKTLKAGEIITAYGKIETKAYFLESGCVQISVMHLEVERILDFVFENNFFASYTSLLTQTPSDAQLTTLTKVEVEVIDYEDLKKAYNHSLLANQLGRIVTESIYVKLIKRGKDLLTKTAEQRYLELLDEKPEIISVMPIHKIAKYLGIHPESLSRIRKSVIS
jgi:CRP-like cAMP-binding protein